MHICKACPCTAMRTRVRVRVRVYNETQFVVDTGMQNPPLRSLIIRAGECEEGMQNFDIAVLECTNEGICMISEPESSHQHTGRSCYAAFTEQLGTRAHHVFLSIYLSILRFDLNKQNGRRKGHERNTICMDSRTLISFRTVRWISCFAYLPRASGVHAWSGKTGNC